MKCERRDQIEKTNLTSCARRQSQPEETADPNTDHLLHELCIKCDFDPYADLDHGGEMIWCVLNGQMKRNKF